MKQIFTILLSISLIFVSSSFGQERSGNRNSSQGKRTGGKIIGQIIDSYNNHPIEYSNIVLYNKKDSTFISGTVSNDEGNFILERVKPGEYYLDVRFMGYKSERIDELKLNRTSRSIDVGIINLKISSLNLDDVEIVGERAGIEYKIDKKVISVDKYYTASSGSATEVLENVPSVDVDVDGNVSLRGSGNFTLLIDNRPTVLDANDALQQIPASTIKDIEIITNPSAKFDPDGPSGIINLIMKKQGYSGSSGTINLNAGLDEKYGGDFLFNYKTGIITTFIGADYNKRFTLGNSESEQRTTYSDRTTFITSDGNSNRGRTSYGMRGGIDIIFNRENAFGLSFRSGNMERESTNDLNYQSWNTINEIVDYYQNESVGVRGGNYFTIDADFQHLFGDNGHEITGKINYRTREMEETSTYELIDDNNDISEGSIITEDGPSEGYRVNLDYTLPFSETNKLELGYQNRLGNSTDNTTNSSYDVDQGKYILDDRFTREIDYQRYIHSLYSLYSGEIGNFGYQGGLRAEYTDRKIELVSSNEEYVIDRWDYFPTIHFSYKLDDANQFILSYTRRIERPRGWNLEPFITWMDAYNVRQGNPDLQPEDIDSYEAGYQRYFGNNLLSLEMYLRKTNDKIEDINSVYNEDEFDNVILRTIENVGKDYSFGTEVMFDVNLTDWYKVNMMGNLFNYKVEGFLDGKDYSKKSTNWRARLNSSFSLSNSTKIQFNNSYRGKTVSAQGTREGYFTSSLAIRHKILENLTATLQFRDLFSSAKREFTSEGTNFYNYNFSQRKAPMVMLNLNYNINNYKNKNGIGNDNGGEEEDF